jgi:hypothetical protein
MQSTKNNNILLPDEFLDKIVCENIMDLNNKIREWNEKMYPNPTYVGHNQLLKFYGEVLNWQKVKKWKEQKLVRTITKKMLPGLQTELNLKNPEHEGKKVSDVDFYAQEDFAILAEKENLVKNTKVNLVVGTFRTNKGRKQLLRDFRLENPSQSELDNLSESWGGFIAWLAEEKLKEGVNNSDDFTDEEKKKFTNLIESVIPKNKEI